MTYTLNIVTHNSDTFLDDVLKNCWALSTKPLSVIIVDNASTDSTLPIIATHQQEHPELMLLRNHTNLGFSKGHNQGIALAARKNADAVFIVNPDVLLEPDCTQQLLMILRHDDRIGSVSPLLYRMETGQKTNTIIDSTGLQLKASLRIVDRGAGQRDRNQYTTGPVFGGSAAAILYRRSALEDIAVKGEIFDDLFFAYKEDVDVAFRLDARGWSHWFCAEAVGFHYRAHRSGSLMEILRGRKHRSTRTRQYSYRNHFWVLAKNVPAIILLRQAGWIFWGEVLQLFYFFFTEPKTIVALGQAMTRMPIMLKKRSRSLTPAPSLRRWIARGI